MTTPREEHRNGDEPLRVQYTLEPGDVLIAPDGVAWYVKSLGPHDIALERTLSETVDAHDIVHTAWRKLDKR